MCRNKSGLSAVTENQFRFKNAGKEFWTMHERIELNPLVCHGKPVIKGTRVMVSTILGALAAGDSAEMILEDYPNIDRDDIAAALAFASDLSQFEDIPYQLNRA
jgi:uncharacterized protein (DUF433 family)